MVISSILLVKINKYWKQNQQSIIATGKCSTETDSQPDSQRPWEKECMVCVHACVCVCVGGGGLGLCLGLCMCVLDVEGNRVFASTVVEL